MTREEIIEEVKADLFRNPSSTFGISVLLITFTSLIPAMVVTGFLGGFLSFLREMNFSVLIMIAATGGAIGLALFHPKPGYRPLGFIPGVTLGVGIFVCTITYVRFREHLFNIELAVPLLVGAAPGFILYYYLVRSKALEDAQMGRRLVSTSEMPAQEDSLPTA
jgi:hypothetical protein